eukprot:4096163-Alexandrium_andersonii.AAC.1
MLHDAQLLLHQLPEALVGGARLARVSLVAGLLRLVADLPQLNLVLVAEEEGMPCVRCGEL